MSHLVPAPPDESDMVASPNPRRRLAQQLASNSSNNSRTSISGTGEESQTPGKPQLARNGASSSRISASASNTTNNISGSSGTFSLAHSASLQPVRPSEGASGSGGGGGGAGGGGGNSPATTPKENSRGGSPGSAFTAPAPPSEDLQSAYALNDSMCSSNWDLPAATTSGVYGGTSAFGAGGSAANNRSSNGGGSDAGNRNSSTSFNAAWFVPKTHAALPLANGVGSSNSQAITPSTVPQGGGGGNFSDRRTSDQMSASTFVMTPGMTSGFSSIFYRPDANERDVIRPFIPRLLLSRCVASELTGFRAWIEQEATVLFIDICSYTSIAARAAEQEGPFTLAQTINAFFETVISVVKKHDGEILKFIGDALICVWTEEEHRDAARACLAAVECALELTQITKEVQDSLKIHVGIRHGSLMVKVLHASATTSQPIMPREFIFVGGEVLRQISAVVDTAAPGEVCIDTSVTNVLEGAKETAVVEMTPVAFENLADDAKYVQRRANIAADVPVETTPHFFIVTKVNILTNDDIALDVSIAAEAHNFYHLPIQHFDGFLHPSVLSKLKAGLPVSHAAEIRDLGVIFIKKTGRIDVTDWFSEVSEVLEHHRCPIISVLEDDKGILVVAAVNLYRVEEGAHDTVVRTISALESRDVGAAIGAASGPCFCGPVGSVARCQWDISGIAAIRACRLMQFAVCNSLTVAIDQSIVDGVTDRASLRVHTLSGTIKKSVDAIPIYTLSHYSCTVLASTARITEYVKEVRQRQREEVRALINEGHLHTCVIVRGASLSGKKMLLLSAVESTSSGGSGGFVPILHKMQLCSPSLSVARTIAEWFANVETDCLRNLARDLIAALDKKSISRSFEIALDLIDELVRRGYKIAIIIDRLQYADHASLMLIQHYRRIVCRQLERQHQTLQRSRSPPEAAAVAATTNNNKTTPPRRGGAEAAGSSSVSRDTSPLNQQQQLLSSMNGEDIRDPYEGKTPAGRFLWLCAFTPMASSQSLDELKHSIFVDLPPVITLEPMTGFEQCALFQSFGFWSITRRTAALFITKSGGMPGQFIKMMHWFGPLLANNFVKYRKGEIPRDELLCEVNKKGVLILTSLGKRTLLEQQFRKIYPGYLSKFVQFCDALTPEDHILLKVIAVISHFNVAPSVNLISNIAGKFIKNATIPSAFATSSQPSMSILAASSGAYIPQEAGSMTISETIQSFLSHRFIKLQELLLIDVVEQKGRTPSQCVLQSPVMREAIFDTATPTQVRAVCKEAAHVLQQQEQSSDRLSMTRVELMQVSLNVVKLLHGAADRELSKKLLDLWMRVNNLARNNLAQQQQHQLGPRSNQAPPLSTPSATVVASSTTSAKVEPEEVELENRIRAEVTGYMLEYKLINASQLQMMHSPPREPQSGATAGSVPPTKPQHQQQQPQSASLSGETKPRGRPPAGKALLPLGALQSSDATVPQASEEVGDPTSPTSGVATRARSTTPTMKVKDGVHDKIEDVKNYECPLLLGPLCGFVNRVGQVIVLNSLSVAGSDKRPYPKITVDLYMNAVIAFEQHVAAPAATTPRSGSHVPSRAMAERDERHLITSLLASVSNVDESIEKAVQFLEYVDTIISSRVDRVMVFVKSSPILEVPEWLVGATRYGSCLKKALSKLETITDQSSIDRPENGLAVRDALLELAVANWASPFPYLTAAKLRDAWHAGWLSAHEIKAIIWHFIVLPTVYED